MPLFALAFALLLAEPQTASTAPAIAPADPDVIAAKLTGEEDPCARRELIVNQYAEEMARRDNENPTPEDIALFRDLAVDMYDASYEMNRPRGAPVIDFATACPARPGRAVEAPAN